jgi:hypothetical protein
MAVRLVCPMCATVVADGTEPQPGGCPSCGARYGGGGDDPPAAVTAALGQWNIDGLDGRAIADRIFRLPPGDPWLARVDMTSDHRDGFYRWWLFVASGSDIEARLRSLLEPPAA